MASVFKLGRDKGKKGTPWYFQYVDHSGKKRMKKGVTDKAITRQMAVEAEKQARMRQLGLIDVEQEERKEKKESQIAHHLSDFKAAQRAKQNSSEYVTLVTGRIQRIIDGCEFEVLGDISADEVESYLNECLEDDEMRFGLKTFNHYLDAIDSFCRWLSHPRRKRLEYNPIAGMSRLNSELDVRHPRRALKPDEMNRLLASTAASTRQIQCYTGTQRSQIYFMSYMTGLRKRELASLTPSSFDLISIPPSLTVEAKRSKHRKKDVLPLHPDLVPLVTELCEGLASTQPLSPKLARRRTSIMVMKDLAEVGIPYKTEAGIADFHASGRHTHITELLRNGVSLPEAKELDLNQAYAD